MHKRLFFVGLLIVVLSLVAVAEEVITVSVKGEGIQVELAREAAKEFEAIYPCVDVKVIDTPKQAQDTLSLYLQFFEAESSKIDVYHVDCIWPGDLAEFFIDFNDYGGQNYAPNHFQSIIDYFTVDGRLVTMPWYADAPVLFYRSDLLEEYGFDGPPETWDELEEMAKVVMAGEKKNNKDFWGYVFQANAYEGLTCDAIEWIASNDGGRIISTDGKITIANQNAAEILEKARGWIGTIAPEGVLNYAEEDSRKVWQSGNALFMRNWPYAYMLGNSEDSAIKGKFKIAPLPHGKGKSSATLGAEGLGVSKFSNNPALAAKVALFLTDYSRQKYGAITSSRNPSIKALYSDEDVLEAVPVTDTLYTVLENSVSRPSQISAPNYNKVSTLFFTTVHDILSGNRDDVMAALEELALDIQEVTGLKPVFE